MIIKNEVELHQQSLNYAKETFEHYTEVDILADVITDPIFHMYPKEDTYNTNDDLIGYVDALFFEFHVYDTMNMTVWKSKRYHDGIMPYDNLYVQQIKVFKDLSTMIALRGKYRVNVGHQEVNIVKI